MRFEIVDRDGLARTGVLEIDGVEHRTPAIACPTGWTPSGTRRGLSLSYAHEASEGHLKVLRSGYSSLGDDREADGALDPAFRGSPYAQAGPGGGFAVLDSIGRLMLDSRRFVSKVRELKSGDGFLRPMFCPVAGMPHRMALLAYCGVDVFDAAPLVMAAESGMYLTATGVLDRSKIRDLPCACPDCGSGELDREGLARHNFAAARAELDLVAHAIRHGGLRELVEARVRSDPWLVQDLRLMDLDVHDLQEMHAPIKGAPFHAGSKESLLRPDIVRWQRRLRERYARPAGASVLLLIPCSAKKPYSRSQSHMRMREAVQASGRAASVHEVIVTSPLGLVPRELELFYPAKDYDIPVTGHWDRDEQALAADMVSWLVRSQGYGLVISHLGDEREAVSEALGDHLDTSKGDPGSRESLDRLTDVLREHVQEPSAEVAGARTLDDMRAICGFQFGDAGRKLCEGARTVGRWPFVKVVGGGRQLCMLTADRGMMSLTLDGGKVLADAESYCVHIEDFRPKGNLFAVGVEDASPEVRIGDDVAVVHDGDLRAVGVARMCAEEMRLANRGEAVHVRHAA